MGSCENLSIVREPLHDDLVIDQRDLEFSGMYISEKVSCLDEGYNWIDSVPICFSELNWWEGFPDGVFPSSRRSIQESQLSQKTKTRKVTVNFRKVPNTQQSQVSRDSIFRAVTRKRSCLSKPARSSPWGKSVGISQINCESNERVSNQALNQGSLKSADTQQKNKIQIKGNPQGSSEKDHAPKRYIRLKIKFGKSGNQPLFAKLPENKDSSFSDVKHDSKDLELSAFPVKSATEGNENIRMYTSPDSEVINPVPDVSISERHHEDLHSSILSTPYAVGMNVKRGQKKGEKNSRSKYCRSTLKMAFSVCPNEIPSCSTSMEASSNLSGEKEDILEPLPLPKESEHGVSGESLKVESCLEDEIYCIPGFDPQSAESQSSKKMLLTESKGLELPKTLKSDTAKKEHSKLSDYDRSRRRNKSGYKKNQQKSVNQKGTENDLCDQAMDRTDLHRRTGYQGAEATVRADSVNHVASPNAALFDMVSCGAAEELSSSDSAWVQCDDCGKWRRVPVALAQSIDGNCRWICMDNSDKSFADCLISQELSNEEINTELGISNAKADAYKEVNKRLESRCKTGCRKPMFRGIKCNQFLHRTRKAQTIDEIMVCQCKPSLDGRLGCGDECLNRMLNIECVQGTCPCGNLCSNQQFQRHKYSKLELFKAGKKGHGLRVLEDVREGQFIIEYVGEVLDSHAYEARLKDYAAKGQKHFYLMTLNGNEVIDAGVKGNLGRFINHSCDPNCRTEKWMVNGEICIGIFALRDIKKEEELTFDYNYVRLFGAAVKKCYCGSSQCQGYMGGDLLNGDVVIQSDSESDSEEECSEPVILEEEVTGDKMVKPASRSRPIGDLEVQIGENLAKESEKMNNVITSVGLVSVISEIEDSSDHSASSISQRDSSEGKIFSSVQSVEVPLPAEDVTSMAIATVQQGIDLDREMPRLAVATVQQEINLEREMPSLSFCPIQTSDTYSMVVNKSSFDSFDPSEKILQRSRPLMKTSGSSGSEKKGKNKKSPPDSNKVQKITVTKSQMPSSKPKGIAEGCPNGRTEAVEMKLNELLDSEGGISKRKDATKGYLKLLLLTAASRGNVSSEAIQSNRDLSMILDALLKTRSRAVLMDIINKNGLQMLHNIIKQYKGDFKKIPILRKILKVLEYLASREILALEHIVRGPPCRGMESFRDSLLSLTEHDDKQVHQIARNFRDRWIPRPFRKPTYTLRDEGLRFAAQHLHSPDHSIRLPDPVDSATQSKVETTSVCKTSGTDHLGSHPTLGHTNITKTHKRKSRWDQPAEEPGLVSLPSKELKIEPRQNIAVCSVSVNQTTVKDVPSGFSCLLNTLPDIVLAQPQEKFVSRLPISYGIPLAIMQQFGSPCTETSENWSVAPGMPFQPFPPVPSYPREKKSLSASSSYNSAMINNHDRKEQNSSVDYRPGTRMVDEVPVTDMPCSNTRPGFKRTRGPLFDSGRKHFRQQKWNVPPWIRNGWANTGAKVKAEGKSYSIQVGNLANEVRNSYHHQEP